MSAEENKAFVRRYFEAINGKPKPAVVVDEYISDADQALKQHIAFFEAAFPRYELIAEDMIAENDKVAVRATARGTHKGEFMGIPPTGKQINISAMLIYRIANSKIVEHWMEIDAPTMMKQLGVQA